MAVEHMRAALSQVLRATSLDEAKDYAFNGIYPLRETIIDATGWAEAAFIGMPDLIPGYETLSGEWRRAAD
jgi:hypothetical protein